MVFLSSLTNESLLEYLFRINTLPGTLITHPYTPRCRPRAIDTLFFIAFLQKSLQNIERDATNRNGKRCAGEHGFDFGHDFCKLHCKLSGARLEGKPWGPNRFWTVRKEKKSVYDGCRVLITLVLVQRAIDKSPWACARTSCQGNA